MTNSQSTYTHVTTTTSPYLYPLNIDYNLALPYFTLKTILPPSTSFSSPCINLSTKIHTAFYEALNDELFDTSTSLIYDTSPFSTKSLSLTNNTIFSHTENIGELMLLSEYEPNPRICHNHDYLELTPLHMCIAALWGIPPFQDENGLQLLIETTNYIDPSFHALSRSDKTYIKQKRYELDHPLYDKFHDYLQFALFITFIPLHHLHLSHAHFFVETTTQNIYALPTNDISCITIPHNLVPIKYLPLDIFSLLHLPNSPRKDIIYTQPLPSSPSH